MQSSEIIEAFDNLCSAVSESAGAQEWVDAQPQAIIFGVDEFEIDRVAKRLVIKGAMGMSLAADESMFESNEEHGWLALMMEGGGFKFALGSGNPFSHDAAAHLPSVAGFVKAAPAAMAAKYMAETPIPGVVAGGAQMGSALNREQRRAAAKQERRSGK